MKIDFTLNGKPVSAEVSEDTMLLHLVRDTFGLTGSKAGCETGTCGTCSMILDGKLVKSCQFPAKLLAGKTVVTIEGVCREDGTPSDLQQALINHGAVQCGYCTPAMVMAGEVLLSKNLEPTRNEIRQAISSVLCRCTGYQQIVDAIEETAAARRAV